ncbi:MAG: hypothetical protein ACI9FJ_001440 [Alteromonadaceae bacterium]|jgi:hypothetical protein
MKSSKIKLHQRIDEVTQTIEGKAYQLIPKAHQALNYFFETKHRYSELNKVCQQRFERHDRVHKSEFEHTHQQRLKHVIPADLCDYFIKEAKKSREAIYHPDFINSLLPLILSDDIDAQLCSYFNSEYTLLWFTYTTEDQQAGQQNGHWQCDKGPEKQLTMQIFLNGYEQHQGNTRFVDKATTDRLKEVGYIFADIEANPTDIGPLCDLNGINLTPLMHENIKTGDALLFNPNQVAYSHKSPELTSQHVLQLCFIPSPYPWKFTKDKVLYSHTHWIDFEGPATKLLSYLARKPGEVTDWVMIPAAGEITSPEQLNLWLHNMYADHRFADIMFTRLIEADPKLEHLNTTAALLDTLKMSFKGSINWEGELGIENIRNLAQVATYELELKDSLGRYNQDNKPAKTGIYWPIPNHATHPGTKYETVPYVKKYPIMDIDTAIGSAGSCFAQEIAMVFQETGHNYIITERNDDPSSGLIIDNYHPGDEYAISCANYGIIFNTPSFRQLAERAFETKPTKQLLFQQLDGSWVDPYRENVMFMTHEAYVNDYESHLAATRSALEQVEVFIITLGLNECWEFRDGSVMSRMPRPNIYPLVKHKTLTVQENVDNVQAFFDIVKQHNPRLKLIISVSPVPFMATGRADEHHVITANAHSKAVLRVAADELVNNNPDMYYLPSYEMVTDCIKEPWAEDERHVKKSTVEKVVKMFQEIFIKS